MLEIHSLQAFKSLASAYSTTAAYILSNVPRHGLVGVYCLSNVLLRKTLHRLVQSFLEAPPGFEPGHKGFADLGLTAWLWCHIIIIYALTFKMVQFKKMERKTRFELATFALARRRSTTEPFPQKKVLVGVIGLEPMTPCL